MILFILNLSSQMLLKQNITNLWIITFRCLSCSMMHLLLDFQWILIFSLPQTAQFDKSINLFYLVLLTLELLLPVFFFTTKIKRFPCFYMLCYTAFLGFLISSFISLYFFDTLLTGKTHHKALETKTLIGFNLDFANKTI